jgi:hypothetical protein
MTEPARRDDASRQGVVSLASWKAENKHLRRFGNLPARNRREARRIIADGGPLMFLRLRFVGERLMTTFDEIDSCTTVAERLMLIGANPADAEARDLTPERNTMLYLLVQGLEWSAQRRRDEWIDYEAAPLYWSCCMNLLEWAGTDEGKATVAAAARDVFGTLPYEPGPRFASSDFDWRRL